MKARCQENGTSVSVAAEARGNRDGYLWMVDANEKDRLSGLVCRCVAGFLESVDLWSADIKSLISRIDREVLPEAAREWRVAGLAASVLFVRISREVVTIGHVGEIRARLIDRACRTIHVTSEHNVFSTVPEPLWPRYHVRSDREAKETILAVVGGGTAVPNVVELLQPSSGALFASSHLWHQYSSMELPDGWDLQSAGDLPATSEGQAIGTLSW